MAKSNPGSFRDRFRPGSPEEKFAKKVIKRLTEARPTHKWEFDEESFALKLVEPQEPQETMPQLLFLEGLYQEYSNAAESEKATFVDKAVQLTEPVEMPETFEEAAPHLLVSAMPLFNVVLVGLQMQYMSSQRGTLNADTQEELPFLPCSVLTNHLGLIFVVDKPQGKLYVDRDTVKKWGVPINTIFEKAVENLAGLTTTGGFNGLSREEGGPCCLYQSVLNDSYEGARLIFPQIFQELPVKGEMVLAVPNNDILLITGSEEEDGLTLIVEAFEKAQAMPHPLPPIAMVVRDGQLQDFLPPETSPHHNFFKRMAVVYYNTIYAEQKKLLDESTQGMPDAPFVALYQALEKTEGDYAVSSVTTWSQSVKTLLPLTEQIALVTGEGEAQKIEGFAPFIKVAQIAGSRLVPTADYPPRFYTEGALSEAEIKELVGSNS
ncbi:MAG: hypothetical protein J0M35_16715 [Candidatus Obscuribacter phosphatis]|uniref:Uncharacterized protein n=1 Tax=Candidatus Obscuribacter phosphatis TaxID=1906157 RepID=A0A8J7PKA4_9BACT|nr:hypothetical protein [Candidatus Obscuribacter phosphatis]